MNVGFLKCNIDATIFSDVAVAGYGWVLRDSLNFFIACDIDMLDDLDSVYECEVIWLLEDMTSIHDAGYFNVIFESDAEVVIDAINLSEEIRSEFDSII